MTCAEKEETHTIVFQQTHLLRQEPSRWPSTPCEAKGKLAANFNCFTRWLLIGALGSPNPTNSWQALLNAVVACPNEPEPRSQSRAYLARPCLSLTPLPLEHVEAGVWHAATINHGAGQSNNKPPTHAQVSQILSLSLILLLSPAETIQEKMHCSKKAACSE